MKVILASIVILTFSLNAAAHSSFPFNDTTNLTSAHTPGVCTEVIEANVVFPELLKEHEEESLEYIEKFANSRRDYLIRMHTKSKKYFSKINTIFIRYGIPKEFCVLMALESAFNANAISSAGAVGYWQIMEDVAKEYGLRTLGLDLLKKPAQKPVKGKPAPADDRKNFVKATHAAGKYLRDRARNLDNDCLLMAASYNWGVGNVWNSLQRTGKKNAGFWDIKKYLPGETKAYVMNFIAMNVIFHNYDKFLKKELRFRDKIIFRPEDAASTAMLQTR